MKHMWSDEDAEELKLLQAHVLDGLERDAVILRLEESLEQKRKQALQQETEAFISNLPYAVNATELADFIENLLGGAVGDNVVRCQVITKNGKSAGRAVLLFRNDDSFRHFQSLAVPSLSIKGRQIKVSKGNGDSKLKRELASESNSFDLSRFQLGLPYHPRQPLAAPDKTTFVLSAEFAGDAVSKLQIDLRRATIGVFFCLGGEEYRADYSFRRMRACRLELDEQDHVVLKFRSEECARLHRKLEESSWDASLMGILYGMQNDKPAVRSSTHLWECGVQSADQSDWIRTTDPFDANACEVFKNSLVNRLFLKMSRGDARLPELVSLLQSFHLVRHAVIDLRPARGIERRTAEHKAGDVAYYCNRSELDVFRSMREQGLPFDMAYWVHALVGANKIDVVQQNEASVSALVQLLLRLPSTIYAVSIFKHLFLNYSVPFVEDFRQWIEDRVKSAPLFAVSEEEEKDHPVGKSVQIRQVNVTPLRICPQPESFEPSNRVVREYKRYHDRFLRVRFVEENGHSVLLCARSKDIEDRIRELMSHGIWIGGYHYCLLAFSNASLREQGCWFYDETSRPGCLQPPPAQAIRDWIGDLSSITVIGKYAARLGQGFSSTQSVATYQPSEFAFIPDVWDNGYCFSDGVGVIAQTYADSIAKKLELKETPSALQVRFGGGKGMLTVMPDAFVDALQGTQRVYFRKSMMKFASTHSELEVNDWSRKKSSYLNRQIIAILSSRGVCDEVFLDLLHDMLAELDAALRNSEEAIKLLMYYTDAGCRRCINHTVATAFAALRLLQAGVRVDSDPFVAGYLFSLRQMLVYDLFTKARILVKKGVLLIGVMDETSSLQQGEVFVQYTDEEGAVRFPEGDTVIVGRSPSLHCGDIRKLRPRKDVPGLAHMVDVVVFPSLGNRPHANEMSGGDLDGDIYFVIWDPNLFPAEDHAPMDFQNRAKPADVPQVSIVHIGNFFVDYIKNDQLGRIANTHLALSDLESDGVMSDKCVKLAEQHSIAVDFAKTGIPATFPDGCRPPKYPSFMENPRKERYESQKVLGRLHAVVTKRQTEIDGEAGKCFCFAKAHAAQFELDDDFCLPGHEAYLKQAAKSLGAYNTELLSLMKHYEVYDEVQLISGILPRHKRTRRGNDEQDHLLEQVRALKEKFWHNFHDEFAQAAPSAESEVQDRIKQKASAWYCCTYSHLRELKECSDADFAPLFSFPWIVYVELCEIKEGRNRRGKEQDKGHQGAEVLGI